MRPINNVVDVTNYVMLELGQPNHAYDLDTLGGGGFRVRPARDGETLTTLDGVERTLTADDLLICDADDAPIGIAGIMGGADTEISDATTDGRAGDGVVRADRRSARPSRRLGLRSEASARFERGVDPYGIDTADRPVRRAARARRAPTSSCTPAPSTRAATAAAGRALVPTVRISAGQPDPRHRRSPPTTSPPLLDPIGFTVSRRRRRARPSRSRRGAPTATEEIDVIEEVARHYGYDRIGKTRADVDRARPADRRASSAAAGCARCCSGSGITEAMPNPFLAPGRRCARAGLDGDALHDHQPARRRGERAAHVAAARAAARRSPTTSRTAAPASRCSRSATSTRRATASCPTSTRRSASSSPARRRRRRSRCGGSSPRRWASARASTRAACRRACTRRARRRSSPGATPIGAVGEVAPGGARGVRHRPSASRRSSSTSTMCSTASRKPAPWKPTSRYPSSDLDLAFVAARRRAGREAREGDPPGRRRRCSSTSTLFDVYRGAGVGDGRRSLAYRLRLQAPDRTLTDADVADVRARGHGGGRQARGRAARLMADTDAARPAGMGVGRRADGRVGVAVRRPGRGRAQRR